MSKLIIAIPVYNEAENILSVIEKIPKSISGVEDILIIVVDDGSTDDTVALAKSTNRVRIFSHEKNYGVGVAFRTAVDKALELGGDILVTMDGDGQFDAADIAKLIAPIINNGYDFVTASRFADKKNPPINMPKVKVWGNKIMAALLSSLTSVKINDVSCGFRAYSREALLNLSLFGDFTYTQETILNLAFNKLRVKELPINVKYFKGRKSRVANNLFAYSCKAIIIIFSAVRDYKPLKFFGYLGLFIFIIGLFLDICVFNFYLHAGQFTPYKSVIIVGAFLNFLGFVIIIFGLLADMLDRIKTAQDKTLYYAKKRYYETKN